MSSQISINDFNLFHETIKATSKVVESAKISIDQNGLAVYGAHGTIVRCEIITNSVYSQNPVSFSIKDLKTLEKVLSTVKEIHKDDFTDLKFILDLPSVKFQSKKFKTKIQCCTDDIIEKWISKKIEATLTPVFEFTTTSDLIKRINSHSYIFSDSESLRIYLETKDDMENNSLFASIGNRQNNLNNEMTLKFGAVTYGKLEDDEHNEIKLTLDLERLNLFNCVQSNDIKVSLMKPKCIVSKTHLIGKNNSFFDFTTYMTLLKN